jgi:hypothetical protein
MEQSNTAYLRIQEEMKAMRIKQEEELRDRDYFVQRLITKSIDIKNQILTIDEKKH